MSAGELLYVVVEGGNKKMYRISFLNLVLPALTRLYVGRPPNHRCLSLEGMLCNLTTARRESICHQAMPSALLVRGRIIGPVLPVIDLLI